MKWHYFMQEYNVIRKRIIVQCVIFYSWAYTTIWLVDSYEAFLSNCNMYIRARYMSFCIPKVAKKLRKNSQCKNRQVILILNFIEENAYSQDEGLVQLCLNQTTKTLNKMETIEYNYTVKGNGSKFRGGICRNYLCLLPEIVFSKRKKMFPREVNYFLLEKFISRRWLVVGKSLPCKIGRKSTKYIRLSIPLKSSNQWNSIVCIGSSLFLFFKHLSHNMRNCNSLHLEPVKTSEDWSAFFLVFCG